MKKIKLFFVATLLFSGLANSQITKGNWMVGGTASFKSNTSKQIDNGSTLKDNYSEISPNLGYFIIDKLAIGSKARFYYSGYEGAHNKGFSIGPFVRYYFLKPEKIVNIFTQANFGYGESINSENTNYPTRDYGFKVGPVICFNESVAIEMGLEYNKSNQNSTYENNSFQISIGFQIHLKKE